MKISYISYWKKNMDFSTPFQQIQDLSRGIRSRALGRSSSLRGDKPNSFPKRRKGLGVRTERWFPKRFDSGRGETLLQKNGKKHGKKSNEIQEMKINEWNENKPQEMRGSYQ